MAISKFKKPILAKFSQGNSVDSAEFSKLGDWTVIYYTRSYQSGSVSRQLYGLDDNFDLVLTFISNDITRKISENTLFLVDEYPTNLNTNGNYTVRRLVRHDNNEIVVGLKKQRGVEHKNLYYYDSGILYACQVNYDSSTHKAYVDKYSTIPLDVGSVVWDYEPDNQNDTENRYTVTSVTNVGIVENLNVFKEITLGVVNGN